MKLAEDHVPVDLFSLVPVKRSHSVCAQGGINACNEVARQQGYSEWEHFHETIKGGDFLANQPPVLEMARMAPNIIDLLDRMGVPFNRTSEGYRALRLFGGSLFKRTHFAGATTGQQLLYALDEQCRRWEAEGRIRKYEFWDFLAPVLDDSGRCVGIIAQDLRTMQIRSFRGDAVIMATGGNGLIFGQSTMSVICTGSASARCYAAGARLGNPEFVQVHPTAIPGEDKCRLMSESARGEGGRIWVPKKKGDPREPNQIPEGERDYFLERIYPKYKNIVPRDIATREIFYICEQGYGVGNGQMVYLDLTERATGIKYEVLKMRLGGILEIYEKFVGVDPLLEPMKIYPAIHYSMGGLWVDYARDEAPVEHGGKALGGGGMKKGDPRNQSTNIPGLYAAGEADFQYHGANRLGANSLLSCIFTGLYMGPGVKNYIDNQKTAAADAGAAVFESRLRDQQKLQEKLLGATGDQNPYQIQKELGKTMSDNCTIIRVNKRMKQSLALIEELKQRYQTRLRMPDGSSWSNQTLGFARSVWDMLLLSEAITKAAIAREESRGAHFKIPDELESRTDIPLDDRALKRDDTHWLKTTLASYRNGQCELSYEPVDISLAEPVKRDYGKTSSSAGLVKTPAPPAERATETIPPDSARQSPGWQRDSVSGS
jgi:succinate dehydrogenase / fumarate reductase flavoprotein subunit